MKNFSEATATKSDIEISLHLRPIGEPCVRVKVCDIVIVDDVIKCDTEFKHCHDLLTPLDFSIELYDKKYSLEFETAIIVDKMMIDGISIIPEMSHLFEYVNDHDFTEPTCYLGFNGIWRLDTKDCFYQWWHQQSGQGWLLKPRSVGLAIGKV